MDIEITLKELNGKQIPAVTSLQVAEAFGKEHFHVLRDIRETMDKCSESFTASNFGLSEYTDSTGRKLPLYILSKDVARALGYPESSLRQLNNLFGHVPDEWKGRNWIMTPGMALEMLRDAGVAVEVIDN